MDKQLQEGIVKDVLLGGEGIISSSQGSVLVPDVLAQEHVTYQIKHKRRGALRGTTVSIEQPSPHRVTPPCEVALSCGGCALQHISTAHQASIKSAWVFDNFKKIMDERSTFIPVQIQHHSQEESPTQNQAGRRRLRWFIDHEHTCLGFYQRQSQHIVKTTFCPVITARLDTLRQTLQAQLPALPSCLQSIQAIELSNGIHLILESDQEQPPSFSAPNLDENLAFPIQWWWKTSQKTYIQPINKPTLTLVDNIHLQPYADQDLPIQIAAHDFIQGNQQGNQTLIDQILAWTQGDTFVVDLFSGCGNLSLPIAAAHGAKVQGAELHPQSVQAANHNAQRLKLDATYQSLDLFSHFKLENFIAADTIIIDPPRKGAQHICSKIQQFFPKKIIMVNCDPAAGARDAKLLQRAGFRLKSLRALDLFPFTGHVEALSLWVSTK